MKNIHQVLTSFLTDRDLAPLASCLKSSQNLAKLKHILPADMQEGLLSITYRAPKLLFCFKHPSHAYNFNHYKKKDISYCLRTYADSFQAFLQRIQVESMADFLQQVQIYGYVPKGLLHPPLASPPPSSICFVEPARGQFINHATDRQLYERFEEIRALIRKHSKEQDSGARF